jgi:hypothetical protein
MRGAQRREPSESRHYPNDRLNFYEVRSGQEKLVRSELPDGRQEFYDGAVDEEGLVRAYFVNRRWSSLKPFTPGAAARSGLSGLHIRTTGERRQVL